MSPAFFATRAVMAAAAVPGAAKKVAFIGLGNMGGHMVANLLKQGFEVSAFDISKEANDRAAALGATVASTPADAAVGASTVITMLPANQHVTNAYLGDNGILSTISPGTLCIDSSTVDPKVSRDVAKALSGECIHSIPFHCQRAFQWFGVLRKLA
jgi:3-hydroxyisobutyrate dehydrogenase-like beta-hydroxyacid dehydrogenase